MSEFIQIIHEDRFTTIKMARPEKRNAIDQAMYRAMADAINAYGVDDNARALIITAEGDFFTAGNDLQDFPMDGADSDEIPPVGLFLLAIRDCPKPIIAAVNGPAVGVGLTMLLHCDLVYATNNATFSAPFVKLGLVPEAGASMLLPAAVGMAVANDILLAGRMLNAEEALQFGLVARLFPQDKLASETKKIAMQMALSAPNSVKRSKRLIRNQRNQVATQMDEEKTLFLDQLQSPEFRESVAAMMQKRQPSYT